MPITVALHKLEDLSLNESSNQFILRTNETTDINIEVMNGKTFIWLPYGNKFDIIDGRIVIHEQ